MTKASHSNLRHLILSALDQKPAVSITTLAQDLGVLRPSVSRAVNLLQSQGLIKREKRILSLTETGQEEFDRLNTELAKKMKKDSDLYTRILVQAQETADRMLKGVDIKMINSVIAQAEQLQSAARIATSLPTFNTLIPTIQPALNQMNALSQAVRTVQTNGILQAMRAVESNGILQAVNEASGIFQTMKGLTGSLNALAQIQSINLNWIQTQQNQTSRGLRHLLFENNAFLSSMMIDFDAITQAKTISERMRGLIIQTFGVANAYSDYYKDIATKFNQIPDAENLEWTLVIPTTATASLVSSTRGIIESHSFSQSEEKSVLSEPTRVRIYSEQYIDISAKLEGYLSPLVNKRFVRKWHGAWQTLLSQQSDDRYSQVAHSGRELLMQLLEYLAPENQFTKEELDKHHVNKPTRRMQVRYILGNSKTPVDWVERMAAAVDSMYDILAAESHKRDDSFQDDDIAASLLLSLGGLLLFILKKFNNRLP
jgi:DNA-binding MarR family transcriptional regulator